MITRRKSAWSSLTLWLSLLYILITPHFSDKGGLFGKSNVLIKAEGVEPAKRPPLPRSEVCLPLYEDSTTSNDPTGPRDHTGDLLACFHHEKRTCCGRERTAYLSDRIRSFAAPTLDISQKCKDAFRTIICAECDGGVGVGAHWTMKGEPLFCQSLCDSWFEACRDDYFAPSSHFSQSGLLTKRSAVSEASFTKGVGQREQLHRAAESNGQLSSSSQKPTQTNGLERRHIESPIRFGFMPCVASSIVCSPLEQFIKDGFDLCHRVGVSVERSLEVMESTGGGGREEREVREEREERDSSTDVDVSGKLMTTTTWERFESLLVRQENIFGGSGTKDITCFNGVPAAIRKGPAMRYVPPRKASYRSQRSHQRDEWLKTIWRFIQRYQNEALRHPLAVALIVFVGMYVFSVGSRWRRDRGDEEEFWPGHGRGHRLGGWPDTR